MSWALDDWEKYAFLPDPPTGSGVIESAGSGLRDVVGGDPGLCRGGRLLRPHDASVPLGAAVPCPSTAWAAGEGERDVGPVDHHRRRGGGTLRGGRCPGPPVVPPDRGRRASRAGPGNPDDDGGRQARRPGSADHRRQPRYRRGDRASVRPRGSADRVHVSQVADGAHGHADAAGEVVAEVERLGGEALAIAADAASVEDASRAVEETVERYGRINILVNNAGAIGQEVTVRDMAVEEWDRLIGTDLRGVFLATKYTLPTCRPSR